jgi:hypothetical protein
VIGHTEAFSRYRALSQAHLNFVVAVSHAMPALRADLALPAATLTQAPDYFQASRNPKSEVATYVAGYQDELARSTLISVFSYFEGYARSLFREIVSFHGGADPFKKLARDRTTRFLSSPHVGITLYKRKLQDRRAPHKLLKYRKYGELLDAKGFRFPTDLLAHFGVVHLLTKIKDDRSIRAWEIPGLIEECLLFPMTQAERDLYESARITRNNIAHGKAPVITLASSLRHASESCTRWQQRLTDT